MQTRSHLGIQYTCVEMPEDPTHVGTIIFFALIGDDHMGSHVEKKARAAFRLITDWFAMQKSMRTLAKDKRVTTECLCTVEQAGNIWGRTNALLLCIVKGCFFAKPPTPPTPRSPKQHFCPKNS